MDHDYDTDDITLLIAQARRHRSTATGDLIAKGSRRAFAWFVARADRLLHALLMSPLPHSKTLKEI